MNIPSIQEQTAESDDLVKYVIKNLISTFYRIF